MPTDGTVTNFQQTLPFIADKPYISNTFSLSKYPFIFSEDVVGAGKIFITTISSAIVKM